MSGQRFGKQSMISLLSNARITLLEFMAQIKAAVEYEAKDLPSAIRICTEALLEYPRNATFFYIRGNANEDSGHLDAALHDYEAYIRLCPDNHNGHFRIAMSHHKAGRLREAISHYERAIETYKTPDSIAWQVIQERTGSDAASNYFDI